MALRGEKEHGEAGGAEAAGEQWLDAGVAERRGTIRHGANLVRRLQELRRASTGRSSTARPMACRDLRRVVAP